MHVLSRRHLLGLVGGVAVTGLTGCLDTEDDDDDDGVSPALTVTVTNEVDREVNAVLAIAREHQSFDDGEVLLSGTFQLPGDSYTSGPMHQYRDGPYRFGLRIDDGEWQELRHRWRLDECIELELHLRIRQQEHGLIVQCRPAPP